MRKSLLRALVVPLPLGLLTLGLLTLGLLTLGLLTLGLPTAALANGSVLRLQEREAFWTMPNGNYAAWNYSPLDRIDRHNVDRLEVKWTFLTGVQDAHQAQPLVVGDRMYILTPKPNTIYALDLSRNGRVEWVFAPEMDTERAANLACCGAQTRGFMYAEGKLFFNTLDGQLFAVDAADGSVVWERQVADLDLGETTTSSPLVVGDNVIVGNEGAERGVRGWVAAYDIDTGAERWKYYNTGPDHEMGIGERFRPFYPADRVDDVGVESWYHDSWATGGATTWGFWSYDPQLDLIYYGTGNCAPWNPDYRRDPASAPGFERYGNKYCASLLARDGSSGELVWAYSLTPQDQWDFDEPGQNFLVDLEIAGEVRKALVKPARNGFFYVFDRLTGELLLPPWKFTTVNWADAIDMTSGIPHYQPEALVSTGVAAGICPFIAGNNWYNDAYSPVTGLVYIAAENECGAITGITGEYVPGENYTLVEFGGKTDARPTGSWEGELQAWNPATGEKVWGIEAHGSDNALPLLATAGGLIFQGTDSGELRAVDARSGEVLWSFRSGSNFRNSPISYLGPDGRQYIAVISSQAPREVLIDEDPPPDQVGRYRRPDSILFVLGLP